MHLPVWASGNVYCNGAKAWEKEQDAIVCPDRVIFVRAVEQADGWHLCTNLNELSDWVLMDGTLSERMITNKKDTCIISDAGVFLYMSLEEVRWYITSSDSKELLSSSVMKPMIPSKCDRFMSENRALCE
jgi:hypothetical protein